MNAMGMLHFLLHCVGPMSAERVRGRWDTETSPLRPLVGLSFDDLTDKLQGFGLTFGERGMVEIAQFDSHKYPNKTHKSQSDSSPAFRILLMDYRKIPLQWGQ